MKDVPALKTLYEWVDRFRLYVNLAAEAGPYAKMYHPEGHEGDVAEALSTITWEIKCRVYNQQTSCRHNKGGKYNPLRRKDHAVTTHTFVDSRTRIKCMLCGLEAWSNSGEDFKFAYMRKLAEDSSNRASASEQVIVGARDACVVVQDDLLYKDKK